MKKKAITARQHKERYGVEKRTKNANKDFFAGIAPLDEIKNYPELQLELYLSGNLENMKLFFEHGGCFFQAVQRRMTIDNNLEVLKLFLSFWEYIPTERGFMIKNASLEFIETYISMKNLGKKSEELVKNFRFSNDFIINHYGALNKRAKKLCKETRKITFTEPQKECFSQCAPAFLN